MDIGNSVEQQLKRFNRQGDTDQCQTSRAEANCPETQRETERSKKHSVGKELANGPPSDAIRYLNTDRAKGNEVGAGSKSR